MGASAVTGKLEITTRLQPAYYVRTGTVRGDLAALLHAPYTRWHLSYVVAGAALAPTFHWVPLVGAVAAFFFGTGIAAHAFDEWHNHPLRTRLTDRTLALVGAGGVAGSIAIAALGALMISPWILAWAVAGVLLMMGYTLEWHRWLHTDLAFAFGWGAFPVLVGYWAQAQQLALAALLMAGAATLVSLAQRALSTPARYIRRRAPSTSIVFEDVRDGAWDAEHLLTTWETPLKLLSAAMVAFAAGLLAARL